MVEIALEIIKFTLPSLILAGTVYYMLRSHFEKEQNLKMIELKSKVSNEMMPLRMQAYERLSLLLHRLAPENLIPRVQNPQFTVADMKGVLVNTIKQEIEHNITQQIYVSHSVWSAIKTYQLDSIDVVNRMAKELTPAEPSIALSEKILQYYMDHPEAISAGKVMEVLKADVKSYLK